MRRFAAALAIVVLMATGCSRTIQVPPEAIEDARLGVRVKTALVNDAVLGPRILEVRVSRGVVTLAGLVGSTDEAVRAIELIRAIPGVADVRSQLQVAAAAELQALAADKNTPVPRPPPAMEEDIGSARNRHLAVGAAIGIQNPTDERLSRNFTVGPMVRLGVGQRFGVGIGFSWFRTDITAANAETLGRVTLRPVMAGVSYTLNDRRRWALGLSMVAGVSFNDFEFEESTVRDGLALAVDNSLVMRPGASLWYDIDSRTAFNVFVGYMFTRPGMTFLEGGEFVQRTVRADAALFSVGLAWKLF